MYTRYAIMNDKIIAIDEECNMKAFDKTDNIDEILDLENRLDVLKIKSDYIDYNVRELENKYKNKKFLKQKISKLLCNVNLLFLIIVTINVIINPSLLISALIFLGCSEVLVLSMFEVLAKLAKDEYNIELDMLKDQVEINSEEISDTEQRLMDLKRNTKAFDLKCNDLSQIEKLKNLRDTYVTTYGLTDNDKTKKLK